MIANQRTGFGSWFVWLFSDRRLLLKIDKLGACPLLQWSMLSAIADVGLFLTKDLTCWNCREHLQRREEMWEELLCLGRWTVPRWSSPESNHLLASKMSKTSLANHLFQRYPKQVSPGSWQYIEGRTAKLVVCPQQSARPCCRPSSWGGSQRSWRWDLFSANSDADRRTDCTFCTHSILYPVFWRTPLQEKGSTINMLKDAQNSKIPTCEVYKKGKESKFTQIFQLV